MFSSVNINGKGSDIKIRYFRNPYPPPIDTFWQFYVTFLCAIFRNSQTGPKFSVFDAKRGTGLKKVHHRRSWWWWLIWAMQAWGTIKTELRCLTMGRVLLLSCTQPMSSLSSWQQSSSRVIRCRGVSLALRGHLCNYPRKLYKWLLQQDDPVSWTGCLA